MAIQRNNGFSDFTCFFADTSTCWMFVLPSRPLPGSASIPVSSELCFPFFHFRFALGLILFMAWCDLHARSAHCRLRSAIPHWLPAHPRSPALLLSRQAVSCRSGSHHHTCCISGLFSYAHLFWSLFASLVPSILVLRFPRDHSNLPRRRTLRPNLLLSFRCHHAHVLVAIILLSGAFLVYLTRWLYQEVLDSFQVLWYAPVFR